MVCCHIQKLVKGAVMTPQTTPTGPQEFVPVEGMLDAPVIFFEICPTIGSHHGIINVLLAAGLAEPAPDARVKSRLKAVAHLRKPPWLGRSACECAVRSNSSRRSITVPQLYLQP